MILVTASILARPDTFDALRDLCLDHVRRSRTEAGCLSYALHVDCENPLRLVFLETWADRAALAAHFDVPASRIFGRAARALAAEAPAPRIFDTELVIELRSG